MVKIKQLPSFNNLEQKFSKDKELKAISDQLEPEYLLAKSLIELRLKKKMSQQQLASKIGTKQPVISRLENMASKPTFSMLQRIAQALNAELRISFK